MNLIIYIYQLVIDLSILDHLMLDLSILDHLVLYCFNFRFSYLDLSIVDSLI